MAPASVFWGCFGSTAAVPGTENVGLPSPTAALPREPRAAPSAFGPLTGPSLPFRALAGRVC